MHNYIKLNEIETQLKTGKIWDEKREANRLFLHQENIITIGILAHSVAARVQTTAILRAID